MSDDEIKREIELIKGDGTDRLLTVLYGESSAETIRHAIGGSESRMLGDAAELIVDLRKCLRGLYEAALGVGCGCRMVGPHPCTQCQGRYLSALSVAKNILKEERAT